MRIAAIADIHGNAGALLAVLADIDRRGTDGVVNLGDHASGPLEAARTLDILMARPMPAIRGNHDRWLIEQTPDAMGPSDIAAHRQLSPRHLDWLTELPSTCWISEEVLACHGTPTSDTDYWLEQVSPGGHVHMAPASWIEAQADGIAAQVMLCGHTHTPRCVRLRDGRLVINPGSVGCPGYTDDVPVAHVVQVGTPLASYAILQRKGGTWSVEFHLVPYDHDAAARLAAEANRLDWAAALATGWVDRR